MTVRIEKSKANGIVSAPPSKSVCHRALICAALAGGGRVSNVSFSNDIKATLGGLNALGSSYHIDGNTVLFSDFSPKDNVKINCMESGSTLRLLIPVAAALCKNVEFYGSEYLFSRPLTVYEQIFNDFSVDYEKKETSFTIKSKLVGGIFKIPGNISSQFVSGLSIALPLFEKTSEIVLTTRLESAPYVDLTLDTMSEFSVITDRENGRIFYRNGMYTGRDYTVEGDYSNAVALEAFNIVGGNVTVTGLNPESRQGDKIYKQYLKMICDGNAVLDITDCPDLAPVLMAAAALSNGADFVGTKRLKLKESDRGSVMHAELEKFGANVEISENEITVSKASYSPKVPLSSHNDHRIVMALVLLSSVYGGEIENAEAINKSFPDYFTKIKSLGIKAEIV